MKPPGGECHDLFGADFNGSPSHLRVLKPPGGGSSDIFGGANESVEVRKVRAKQAASSNLFLGSSEMTSGLATPASGVSQPPQTNGVAPKNGNGNAKLDGNPVTGEGYDSNASSKPSTPLTNGSSNPPSTPNTAQSRQRVPPGGFSSGLW